MSNRSKPELLQKACSGTLRRKMEPIDPLSAKAVGSRLELIRAAMDWSNETIAHKIRASAQQWGNWKSGRHVISHIFAARLCALTGATTDFIYRDVRDAISVNLATKLDKIEQSAPAKRAVRRR